MVADGDGQSGAEHRPRSDPHAARVVAAGGQLGVGVPERVLVDLGGACSGLTLTGTASGARSGLAGGRTGGLEEGGGGGRVDGLAVGVIVAVVAELGADLLVGLGRHQANAVLAELGDLEICAVSAAGSIVVTSSVNRSARICRARR